MEQGRLDSTGVGNITALGNMITTQKVEYDFKYYKMEFDADIKVLILSEGKSLLPVSLIILYNYKVVMSKKKQGISFLPSKKK